VQSKAINPLFHKTGREWFVTIPLFDGNLFFLRCGVIKPLLLLIALLGRVTNHSLLVW
jgi:hypothetical protein